jgi:hypothetical protein
MPPYLSPVGAVGVVAVGAVVAAAVVGGLLVTVVVVFAAVVVAGVDVPQAPRSKLNSRINPIRINSVFFINSLLFCFY